jgi:hypothetical protein
MSKDKKGFVTPIKTKATFSYTVQKNGEQPKVKEIKKG